jgi:hypothetical protein
MNKRLPRRITRQFLHIGLMEDRTFIRLEIYFRMCWEVEEIHATEEISKGFMIHRR